MPFTLNNQRYEGKSIEVLTPRNCQTVEFTFKADRIAKAVGTLAANDPKDGTILSGILVEKVGKKKGIWRIATVFRILTIIS